MMNPTTTPWLDDPRHPRALDWLQEQRDAVDNHLASIGTRDAWRHRVLQLVDRDQRGVPEVAGEFSFELRRTKGESQWSLWVSSEGEHDKLLVDAADLSKDGNTAITLVSPSPDGKRVAWAYARGGSDWQTIRVRDVETGYDLPDEICWIKAAQCSWSADGTGFFYLDFEPPSTNDVLTEKNTGQSIRYHRLGADPSEDRQVLVVPNADWLSVSTEPEDDVVVVEATDGTTTVSLHIGRISDVVDGEGGFRSISEGGNPISYLGWCDGAIYHVFREKNEHVLRDVDGETQELQLPAGPLNPWAAVVVGRQLVIGYRSSAAQALGWHDIDTGRTGTVDLDPGMFARQIAKGTDGSVLVHAAGWALGDSLIRIDPLKGTRHTVWDCVRRPRPDHLEYEVVTADGTGIPIVLIGDKVDDREGPPRPTLLTGYGGYGADFLTYGFEDWHQAWIDAGGIVVLAGIRGGSEKGEAWHDAAVRERKTVSYEDFLAVAQHLVAEKVTTHDRLGINGMSNGGLLIGYVMTEHPELFGAAVPEVGVMDMLRFHLYTVGAGWIREFGNPDAPTDAERLRRISPLHRLRTGVDYPPTLVVTADKDDRVVPGPHSYQFIQRLQSLSNAENDHYLRVQPNAGHAAGRSTSTIAEERGDILCFLSHHLGLTIIDDAVDTTDHPGEES